MTALDMTPMGLLDGKSSTQTNKHDESRSSVFKSEKTPKGVASIFTHTLYSDIGHCPVKIYKKNLHTIAFGGSYIEDIYSFAVFSSSVMKTSNQYVFIARDENFYDFH